MIIDKEDFELWRAHPVTEAVTRALQKLADRNKDKWIKVSWEGGEANPVTLVELRARAQMAQDLSELTIEELNEALDEEPKRNLPDRVQGAGAAEGD